MADSPYTLNKLINLDEEFASIPSAILINEWMAVGKSATQLIEEISDTTDEASLVAKCGCSNKDGLIGDIYLNSGVRCIHCGEEASMSIGSRIQNDIWIGSGNSVGPVLHPTVYRMLQTKMGSRATNGVKLLDIILNVKAKIPDQYKSTITGQGFKWFYDNFDYIIDTFICTKTSGVQAVDDRLYKVFLSTFRDSLFTTHLPMASKYIQPISVENKKRCVDTSTTKLVSAVVDLGANILISDVLGTTQRETEANFYAIYVKYTDYLKSLIHTRASKKTGVFRKTIYGSRLQCSSRTVILPFTGEHDIDEIHLPWQVTVETWKPHLANVLIKSNGRTHAEALDILQRARSYYIFEVDLAIQKIIKDSTHKGLPGKFNRNPILSYLGILLLFCTKGSPGFKQDPCKKYWALREEHPYLSHSEILESFDIEYDPINLIRDKTYRVSPTLAKGPNFDFDGDEMNFVPIFESGLVDAFMNLHPKRRTLNHSCIEAGGGNVTLMSQQFLQLNGFLLEKAHRLK